MPKGGDVRLVELVASWDPDASAGPVKVSWETYEGCRIIGPAVIIPVSCDFEGCTLSAGTLWVIKPGRPYDGAIAFDRCRFLNCTFVNVGIAGDEAFVRRFVDS